MSMTSGIVRDALAGKAKVISSTFDRDRRIDFVSTDSLTVTAGDLFVAIKGEVFDGHDFIASAVEKGCRSVLCEKYPAGVIIEGVDIYLVENSLDSFRILASFWRELIDAKIIAVAGSVGKTTTKDLLHAILSGKWKRVLKTKGSQNGFLGIPMTLCEAQLDTDVAVIEVGIDAPGAMLKHIEVVKPDISIVTAISEEHLEWLKDMKTIAYEENMILLETAQAGGISIINLDDEWISPVFDRIQSETKVGFTLNSTRSGPNILNGKYNVTNSSLVVCGLGLPNPVEVSVPLPGEHNARNLLGAIAAALVVGVKPDEINSGLKHFKPSGGRSQWETSRTGLRVYCDFYNANPASMKAAFDVMSQVAGNAEKQSSIYFCLGDMKELGPDEERLHRELAVPILKMSSLNAKRALNILLIGSRMQWLQDELVKQKFSGSLLLYQDLEMLTQGIKSKVRSDDLVLLKGSHSMQLHKVWDVLKDC
ncbi:MAG: UDP-N-acetylmuramoyl-tripeptide--D-alanyl-D-alanine ligase [Proteobacteria bacterium]|nr:UDP-N-acetylmuramoyl-tripeptide--D-alanyl-D-alanine ligase [Pseudomonadota bacterium]